MKETRGANLAWCSLAMLAGILCIAWSAIFVRWTDMPGPASAFYRLLIPAIALLPTWFFDRYKTPIFVGLLTWLVFRRPPSLTYWLGLALAMTGSLVIVRGDLLRHVKFGSGDAMALAASACFAVYLLATERVRKTASTIGFLRLAILSSTVFLLVTNLAMGTSLAVPSGRSWAALLGLGLISQLGGYLALTYAMGHLPATVTSVSLLSQVPLTALLAALLLR